MKVTWKSRFVKSSCYLIAFAFLMITRSFIVADEAKSSPPTNCPECQAKADALQKAETDLAAKRQSLVDLDKTPEQIKDAESKLVQLKNLKQGGYVAPESKAQLDQDIAELEKNIEKYKDLSLKPALQKEISELAAKRNALAQDLAECRKKCKQTKQPPSTPSAQPEEPQPFQFIMPAPLPHEPVKTDCPECKKIADEINELVGDEALLIKKYENLKDTTEFYDQARRQPTISQEEMEFCEREYNSNNYHMELARAQWYWTSWRINNLLVELEQCQKKCGQTKTIQLPPDILAPTVSVPAPSAPGTLPGTTPAPAPNAGTGAQPAPGPSTPGTPAAPAPEKPTTPPASPQLPPQPVPKPLGEPVAPIPVQPAPQQPGTEPPAQGPAKEKCPECQAKADELQKIVAKLADLKQLLEDIDKGPQQIQNIELEITRELEKKKYAAKEYLPKVDQEIAELRKNLDILKKGDAAKPGLQKEMAELEKKRNKALDDLNDCRKKCKQKEPPAIPGGGENFPATPFLFFVPFRHDPVKAECPECKAKADEINKLIDEENKLIDQIDQLEQSEQKLEKEWYEDSIALNIMNQEAAEKKSSFVVGRGEALERMEKNEKALKKNEEELLNARYSKALLSSQIDSLIAELAECHKKCRASAPTPLPPNAGPSTTPAPVVPGTSGPPPSQPAPGPSTPTTPPPQQPTPGAPATPAPAPSAGPVPATPGTTPPATPAPGTPAPPAQPPAGPPVTPAPAKPLSTPTAPTPATPGPTPSAPAPSTLSAMKDCPECRQIAEELEKTRGMYDEKKKKMKDLESEEALYTQKILEINDEQAERCGLIGYIKTDSPQWNEFMTVGDYLEQERTKYVTLRKKSREKMTALQSEINALSSKIDELDRKLDECRAKCKPPEEPSQAAPAECSKVPFESVVIGSKSNLGSDSAKAVQGFFGGSASGGIMSGGGGGKAKPLEPSSSEKPSTVKSPFKQMTKFIDPATGTVINVAAKLTDKGILIGAEIEKGKDKPTFHSITLHRDDCSMMLPTEYYLYELWEKWWLTVSWTKTTYVNNQVVKQEHGGWSTQGSELLSRGIFASNQGGEESIWRHFGFTRATGGPKAFGAEFATGGTGAGSAQKPPTKCVIHVTQPDQDPVKTVPFVFNMATNPDGTIKFTQVPNVIK